MVSFESLGLRKLIPKSTLPAYRRVLLGERTMVHGTGFKKFFNVFSILKFHIKTQMSGFSLMAVFVWQQFLSPE